jgi:hypothetical protein
MGGMIANVVNWLTPPSLDATPDELQSYRWRVTIYLWSGGIVMTIHILWACGFFAAMGLPGFANAQQVAELKDMQVRREVRTTERDLRDARLRQCLAVQANNAEAKQFAAATIDYLQADYREMTGRPYQVPKCEEM